MPPLDAEHDLARARHDRWLRPARSARRSSRPALISRSAIDSGFSCGVGLHQRADVLEQALAELAVVGVDLAGPLGREDHQAYFESVASSSSSIGGLVMPSGAATVPDTGGLPVVESVDVQ